MKAITINIYGSAEVLDLRTGLPIPKVGPHDILIRNKATSVNPIDVMNMKLHLNPKTCPLKRRRPSLMWP